MTVKITQTKEFGLEVFTVHVDNVHMATYMSKQGALSMALRLKNKLEGK